MTAQDVQTAASDAAAKPAKSELAPKAERVSKAAKLKPPKTEFSGRVGELSISGVEGSCTFALKGKKVANRKFSIGKPDDKMFGAMLAVLTVASVGKSKLHVKTSGPAPEGEKVLSLRLQSK